MSDVVLRRKGEKLLVGEEAWVRITRFLSLLAAVLLPLLGALTKLQNPGATDPLWVRLLLSAVLLVFVGSTYVFDVARRRCVEIGWGLLYVLTAWAVLLAGVNNMSGEYSEGALLVYSMSGLLMLLGSRSLTPVLTYLAVGLLSLSMPFFLAPSPGTSPLFLGLDFLIVALIEGSAGWWVMRVRDRFLRQEKELERQNDLFGRAQEIASVGAWEYDVRTDEGNWTRKAYEILGFPRGEDPDPREAVKFYHPEDQPQVRRALQGALQEGESSDLEVRVQAGEGVQWVRIRGEPQWEGGEVIRVRGTIQDITHQKRREQALRAAKTDAEAARQDTEAALEKAKEANRLKTAFLANISHEIRTPLTSIIGFAELIGSEVRELDLPESPLSGYADIIERGGNRLLQTLDGVLNLSKLQSGEMELELRPVDLSEQARLAVEEVRPKAEEKDVGLHLETAASVTACADEGAVQIVIRNLLSNAVKYTDEGSVTVRTYQEKTGEKMVAVLEVEDTGIGMDPAVAEGLFEPFRQASEGLSREYEGTGVGLAVTNEAATQMNGRVEVETERGKGSRFTVYLPYIEEPPG